MYSPRQLFGRALLLRCPVCGGGPLFRRWLWMAPRCPSCGFRIEREEGYYTGSIGLNLIATELLVTAGLVAVAVATWPNPPWNALWLSSVMAAVVLPLLTFPFSKTLWLAFDLSFRPPTPADFTPDGGMASRTAASRAPGERKPPPARAGGAGHPPERSR